MPALVDVPFHKTPAEAVDIQQIIDMLTARRNTPAAITVNDPLAYAVTLKNTDAASRGLVIYAADGTTVLLQVDSAGTRLSQSGGAAASPLFTTGPGAAPVAAAGDHIHGAGGYSAVGATTLEALYAASVAVTTINYTVAAGILFVVCNAGCTVTLPNAATTNRPITIIAPWGGGSVTVVSAGGGIFGGSVNTTTGAIMNGIVSAQDSITYKSDTSNWRAI
jgi:hypothetical protein